MTNANLHVSPNNYIHFMIGRFILGRLRGDWYLVNRGCYDFRKANNNQSNNLTERP